MPIPETNLTNAAVEQLVQRAKDIIAGRFVPARLCSPQVERVATSLNRQETKQQRHAEDWLNLQSLYGGYATACFTTNEGQITVLAWGDEEIHSLLNGLTEHERKQVTIEFPDAPMDFVPVEQTGASGRERLQRKSDPETPHVTNHR